MSLQINKTFTWLRVCSVPIFLVVSSVPAVWLGLKPEISHGPPSSPVPELKIDLRKITDQPTIKKQTGRAAEKYRNPFYPLKKTKPARDKVNLNSINLKLVVISSHKRLCLINGQVMKEGEETKFFKLKKITDNGIWYTTHTGTYFLGAGESILIDDAGVVKAEQNKETTE